MRARQVIALVVCLASAAVAGCTSDPSDVPAAAQDPSASSPATPAEPAYEKYVALGDSYTAGPFVPTTDVANGCFRSDGNYPTLVAERIDVAEFVDVSCSGASTRDLTKRQATVRNASVAPQLDALDEDTDLVTLGIGGNDFDLFTTLLQTCVALRADDPDGSPCADRLEARGIDLVAQTARIGPTVADAVEKVRERAPEARVLLVGYPRISPSSGTCPRLLPFAAGDYQQGDLVAWALNDSLRGAARSTGVEYVDVYAAAEGHDVCADEPWVNGQVTDQTAGLAFHPLPAGMKAVADAVVEQLDR